MARAKSLSLKPLYQFRMLEIRSKWPNIMRKLLSRRRRLRELRLCLRLLDRLKVRQLVLLSCLLMRLLNRLLRQLLPKVKLNMLIDSEPKSKKISPKLLSNRSPIINLECPLMSSARKLILKIVLKSARLT